MLFPARFVAAVEGGEAVPVNAPSMRASEALNDPVTLLGQSRLSTNDAGFPRSLWTFRAVRSLGLRRLPQRWEQVAQKGMFSPPLPVGAGSPSLFASRSI